MRKSEFVREHLDMVGNWQIQLAMQFSNQKAYQNFP